MLQSNRKCILKKLKSHRKTLSVWIDTNNPRAQKKIGVNRNDE